MLNLWSYIDAFGVIGGNGLCLLGYLDDIEALLLFTRNCPTLWGSPVGYSVFVGTYGCSIFQANFFVIANRRAVVRTRLQPGLRPCSSRKWKRFCAAGTHRTPCWGKHRAGIGWTSIREHNICISIQYKLKGHFSLVEKEILHGEMECCAALSRIHSSIPTLVVRDHWPSFFEYCINRRMV